MRKVLLLMCCLYFTASHAQVDSVNISNILSDSISLNVERPVAQSENYFTTLNKLLADNKFVDSKSKPLAISIRERNVKSKNFLIYAICITVFFFALLKTFYSRYFNNIFRVFFNTSLRQSQITDQLVQAKLPSLFFNIFFVLTGGFYIFLLLSHLGHVQDLNDIRILLLCIAVVALIYFGKYIILKFTGWVSGYKNEADTYIFIIFLINKIIAIILIPIIVIMAFSETGLTRFVIVLSYILIMLMLISRFFRSYSILQNRIQVQRLHFFLYILGIEILPLLLIYKFTLNFLTN